MNDIIEHIQKAREQMLREGFQANTIIIDSEVAKVNGFNYCLIPSTVGRTPVMFLGLKVVYDKNLSDTIGTDCNFALLEAKDRDSGEGTERTPLSEYSTDELLDEIKSRIQQEE